MFEDRADVAEADEDGGGRDEELLSAGKPVSTVKVATVSQHTETIIPSENHKGMEGEESR